MGRPCEHCQAAFTARNPKTRFCSFSCRGKAMARLMPQSQNRNVEKTCEVCLTPFKVKPYRATVARFCSGHCRAKWASTLPNSAASRSRGKPCERMRGNIYRLGLRPTNAFPEGNPSWNKGRTGIHLSPATEFKPGPRPDRQAPIGEVSIRKCHDGSTRAFVKVAQPNKWKLRAVKMWEDQHGPVPKGSVIHHDDRDTLNDAPSNLICLTRAEHLAEHRGEFSSPAPV